MNIKSSLVSLVGVCLAAMSAAVLAHHGDAGRYEDKLTTVKGTVVELQLINPHSIVVVDVMVGRRLKNGSPYMTLSENSRVFDANGKEIYRGNDPGQPNQPGPCAPARTGGR